MENCKKEYNRGLYYSSLLILAVAFILSGCDLAESPSGSLTSETVSVRTSSELEAVVTGPYRSLTLWTASGRDYGNYLPVSIEFQTGKATSEDAHPLLFRFQSDNVTGGLLGDFDNQWEYWYQGVRDANFAIKKLSEAIANENRQVSEGDLLQGLGEVRTLRAFYYFNLVRYFGSVVMDSTFREGTSELERPRTSLKTIYDEIIIPDLEFAVNESGLEDRPVGEDGHITKHVARVLLADVYLTAAGYPYQEVAANPEQNWAEEGLWSQQGYPVNTESAVSFLKQAQAQLNALYGSYDLGTYNEIHDPNGEAIFQAHYQASQVENDIVPASLPSNGRISMYGSEYGTFIPSIEYVNSYHPDDKRIEEDQFFFQEDNISAQYNTNEPPVTFNRPYLYKYYDEEAIKESGQSGLNWTFYRYADVLLMLTEVNWSLRALGEAVSDNDIIKGINEVRARAELSSFGVSDVTLKAIMSERAYELVFENKMLWDQRRTRKALVVGDGEFSAIENLMGHQPSDFEFQLGPKHLLSPIGAREMSVNPEMTQNFGYTPQ